MYIIKIHATHAVPYANTDLTAAYWTTRYSYLCMVQGVYGQQLMTHAGMCFLFISRDILVYLFALYHLIHLHTVKIPVHSVVMCVYIFGSFDVYGIAF